MEFENSGPSSDNVTCVLTEAGGKQIETASPDQAIPIVGASSAPAGLATVSCTDSANAESATVNGAAFTATTTASLPTAGPVLRTGSVTGAAISRGNTLSSVFAPGQCTSGSITSMSVSDRTR